MHVTPRQDGGAQLRLTKDELECFISGDSPAVLQLRERVRSQIFLAECSRICAEDARGAMR